MTIKTESEKLKLLLFEKFVKYNIYGPFCLLLFRFDEFFLDTLLV